MRLINTSKQILSKKTLIILLAIFCLGFYLRADKLTTWPRLGATFDEYAWTWLGISLIEDHVPSSWSPHAVYEGHRKYVKYQDTGFWIVKPYLEHPPFFGLVAGVFAKLNGVHGMFQLTIDRIRPLALILGLSSILALFLLVKEVYDEKTALISSFIYAIIPTVVVGSRIVQNENFFIPLFLFSLYLTVKFIKTGNPWFRNSAAIICGILTLSKVPWFAAVFAVIAILFYFRKYLDVLKFMAIVIPIFSIFILYGVHFNSGLFVDLWKLQLQRYDLAFNSIFALFTEPFLVDRYTVDGWIYFGWFAFFLLLAKDFIKNYLPILGLLGYLAVFVFAIPNEPGHGWYRYPFYPFLAISLAIFVKDYFNKNLLLTFMFILFIGLSLLEQTWTKVFGFSFIILRLFIITSSLSLLPLFFNSLRVKKFSTAINYLMLIFISSLSIFSSLLYNEQ